MIPSFDRKVDVMEKQFLDRRKKYDTLREKLDHTLGLSFCKLLEDQPLYDHRIEQLNDKAVLSVVLVGKGQPLELLRDKVLSNGQLLNTNLEVTVVTPEAEADMDSTIDLNPALHRFIRIRCTMDGKEIRPTREPEWPLGTLTFEQTCMTEDGIRSMLGAHPACSYFLFSEEYQGLAGLCEISSKRVVAHIKTATGKDKDGNPEQQNILQLLSPKSAELNCTHSDKYLKQIESAAYNLHYAYMKGNDPRATSEYIRKTFHDVYNYGSNIECAVHIRSKLRCCGIAHQFDKAAALRFAEELAHDKSGVLVENLSRLEHQRWCISKLLQGYRPPSKLSLIYSDVKVGTHDSAKKWHSSLVRYEDSRALTEQDWLTADPDTVDGLDELDRQTLRIHQICGSRLADADAQIRQYLKTIDACSKAAVFSGVKRMTACAEELDSSIDLLRRRKVDAIFLYRRSKAEMETLLVDRLEPEAKEIKHVLEKLDVQVGLWIEYITRKNYKEQNRILIRQIPFALSKWQDLTLVKLLSDEPKVCFSSTWEIEPKRVVFIDLVDSVSDIDRLDALTAQIDHFLKESCKRVQAEYHFFIYGDLLKFKNAKFFETLNYQIHPIASADPDQIRPEFVALMEHLHADYIDITGGKPELISVTAGCAKNSGIGAFAVRNEQLMNFYGAEALHGIAMKKGLSIQDVFNQSGAVNVKSDGEKLNGKRIAADYLPFWEIAHSHAEYWHGFCMSFVSKVRESAKKKKIRGKLLLPQSCIDEQMKKLDADLQTHCVQILDEMVTAKLITQDADGYHVSSDELMAALVNSGKVLEYFLYFSAKKCTFTDVSMSYQFKHTAAKNSVENELDVICSKDVRTLFISAKNVSADKSKSATFLKHVCYEVDVLASRFGVNPKRVLAAPNAKQFENGELSEAVDYCMQRGVYLLGDECCQPDAIGTVLENIMAGERDWCGFLKPQPVGAK